MLAAKKLNLRFAHKATLAASGVAAWSLFMAAVWQLESPQDNRAAVGGEGTDMRPTLTEPHAPRATGPRMRAVHAREDPIPSWPAAAPAADDGDLPESFEPARPATYPDPVGDTMVEPPQPSESSELESDVTEPEAAQTRTSNASTYIARNLPLPDTAGLRVAPWTDASQRQRMDSVLKRMRP